MNHSQAIQILNSTFNQQQFNEQEFVNFIYHLFGKETAISEQNLNISSQHQAYFSSCKKIANFTDGKAELMVLIVQLAENKNLDLARTLQRNFIAEILQNHYMQYAIVAFVDYNQTNWRFSLVKLQHNFNTENNKLNVSTELSPAKRFSFLLGKNEGNHTIKKQFYSILNGDKGNVATIAQIEQAFSIETITDDFFAKYKELFHRLSESLTAILAKDSAIAMHFSEKQINEADFAKKTLGQIVFLYFLQKKGWFGVASSEAWGSGDKNFLKNYFNKNSTKHFFNDCLEPLFYQALAIDRGENANYSKIDNLRFPFLNGGLFEPINDYGYETNKINIPNHLFSNHNKTKEGDIGDGILDIFDRYNFTVNENEPLECEVAVDPEMLGKVFENLLDIKDRKSKGAFYTPREIVHYMCQESLINYLQTKTNLPLHDLKDFIKNKALNNIYNSALQLDLLLANIKVCDPAVGSGAFMLGMLTEIVNARLALDKILATNLKEYDLKLFAIANSIYGVDLDAGAVEIAKLRLWLALVVEEETPSALPNLDHKIMQGNSLLETYEGIQLFDNNLFINQDKVKDLNDRIIVLRTELKNLGINNITKSKNPDYLKKEKELQSLLKELQDLSKPSFDKNSALMLDLQDSQLKQQNTLNDLFEELQQLIKNYFS